MEKTYELLSQLLDGGLKDDKFSEHLWSTYDPQMLTGLFEHVKKLADDAFKSSDYAHAIEYYTACIMLVRNSVERSKLYANRSLAFIKQQRFDHAYSDALKCLGLTPKWPKAWYRCGAALARLQAPERALVCFQMCAKLMDAEKQDSSQAIRRDIEEVETAIAAKRRRMRYQTDYDRFGKLARMVEEQEKAYTSSQSAIPEDAIQFNDSALSEEQKRYLKAQLTGKIEGENPKLPLVYNKGSRLDLDWRQRLDRSCDARAIAVIKEFLALQSYSIYPQKLVNLLDLGVPQLLSERILSQINSWPDQKVSVILLGCGSLLPAILLKRHCERMMIVTDSALQVDLVMSYFEETKEPLGSLYFTTFSQINAKPKKSIQGDYVPSDGVLTDVKEANDSEMNLRKQGEAALSKAASATPGSTMVSDSSIFKDNDLIILDMEHICPYLLGPNNPLELIKRFCGRLFPNRITLNIALAYIDRTAPSACAFVDNYSVLPLPLPSAYADRVQLVTDFTAAWTLGEFSALPGKKKGKSPDDVLEIDAFKLLSHRSRMNAIVFSLTVYDGDTLILDTWELYLKCAERQMDMKAMAPHFYWLHTDELLASPPSAKSSRSSSAAIFKGVYAAAGDIVPKPRSGAESPLRKTRSSDYGKAPDRSGENRPITSMHSNLSENSAESSSSSSHSDKKNSLEHHWMSELRKSVNTTGSVCLESLLNTPKSDRPLGAYSQPLIRTPYRESHKVVLQLTNGCISGVNVYTESGTYTSSENIVVTENLNGLKWYVHDLLGPLPRALLDGKCRVSSPLCATAETSCSTASWSINQAWLDGIVQIREKKCKEIANKERRIRAHMVMTNNSRTTSVRVCATQILHPIIGLELIMRCIKKSTADITAAAANVIDVHCGLDLFCGSSSLLRVLRQALHSPQELYRIKAKLLSGKKFKPGVEWMKSTGSPVPTGSPMNDNQSDEKVVEEVRKFLFDDHYLRLDRGELGQLRPPVSALDREDLLKALAVLFNCPPSTPGLDQTSGCTMVKQRYDVVIHESPETLYDLVDWVHGSYLRKLLFTKSALMERNAYFYPQRLILKAFLAHLPPSRVNDVSLNNGYVEKYLNELRSMDGVVSWDCLPNAQRVSEVSTVLSVDLNDNVDPQLFSPKTITFKPILSDNSNNEEVNSGLESAESTTGYDPFDDINLEEPNYGINHGVSLLTTSHANILPTEEPQAFVEKEAEVVIEEPPKPEVDPKQFNAVITFAEFELSPESGILSHIPRSIAASASPVIAFPNPRQRYHRVSTSTITPGEHIVVNWQMAENMDDYEFVVPRQRRPAPTRVRLALNEVLSKHSEIAMRLSQLMSLSPDATTEIQNATISLSTSSVLPCIEPINSLIFSSLN